MQQALRDAAAATRSAWAKPATRRRILLVGAAVAAGILLLALTALRSHSRAWSQYSGFIVIFVLWGFFVYLLLWVYVRNRWASPLPARCLTWRDLVVGWRGASARQRVRLLGRFAREPRRLLDAAFFTLLLPTAIAVAFPLTASAWPTVSPREEPFPFAITCMGFAAVSLQTAFLQVFVDFVYLSVARVRDAWKWRRAAAGAASAPVLVAEAAAAVSPAPGGDVALPLSVIEAPVKAPQPSFWARAARTLRPRPLPLWLVAFQALLIVSTAIWGFIEGAADPEVITVTLALPHLPPSLDGFKIAMLSDVHAGPTIGKTRVAAAVAITNSLSPDLTAIVGDLLDADQTYLAPMVTPLTSLTSPTVFVTGNHEYLSGVVAEKIALVQSLGITVLTNAIARVRLDPVTRVVSVTVPPPSTPDDASFDLLGVPDWAESVKAGDWVRADLPAAAAGRNTSRPLVVAAHQPKHSPQALSVGAGLVMNGHVHCGQILPIHVGAKLGNPYFCGMYEVHNGEGEDAVVYVGGGTYGWGPLMRQAAQREITLFVLRSPAVVGPDFKPVEVRR